MANVQIFLSTVSAEFRSYRDALRHDLDRPNVTVKVQEDFIVTGTETLDMLDSYIQHCDAVIHLVGDMTGAPAQAPSTSVIRERYPDFDERLPVLTPFLELDGPALSYTQWEAWLALYHRKPLIICVPETGATRDKQYHTDEDQRASQREHLERLASVERYPGIHFANADRLAVDVLRSQLHDIISSTGLDQATSADLIDFAQERNRHGEVIGRDAVIAEVRQWIDEAAKGWILIKGAPGTGKSAIMTAILDRLEAEYGTDSVPHHFLRRGQGNWSEPDAVLRNLMARLERISTSAELGTKHGLERLYDLLVVVAEQYAAKGRRLVLIIDGLDEASVPSGVDRVLGQFLPTSLPDNVFILCASRPYYPQLGWLDQRGGRRMIDLDAEPWLANNRDVVDAYWRKRGPQLQPPLDIEVLEKAIESADGNMLHAVTLFDAFENNTQARDPNSIPIGFRALLEDLWVRLVDLDDRDTSARVIAGLGLLAIAGEALPLATLANLLDWQHPGDITDFKRYARPFLLEESADWHGGEERYRPFHDSMREFLTSGDRMFRDAYLRYHELLARRLSAWPPEDGTELERGYAAQFALVHLFKIEDWQRIGELLGDLGYGVAALEALGPQLLLARLTELVAADKSTQLGECARILQRVLRLESQSLGLYPRELPNLVHNRLTCLGWSRDQIRSKFTGFDRGWGLINAVAIGDELCILRGHTSTVYSCDVDRQGRFGVSGGWDGHLRVWDLSRGTALHVLRPRQDVLRCDIDSCAISPDGNYVAATVSLIEEEPRREYCRVLIWDARDGLLIHDDEHEHSRSAMVAFASNDTAIAVHRSGTLERYDIGQDTSELLSLDEEIGGRIAVDPSGALLAATTSDGCGVWRITDGTKLATIPFEGATACGFSPNGEVVAVGKRDRAAVARSRDGAILYSSDAIGQLSDCCMLDGKRLLFTSDWGCELVVWDMESDRSLVRYEGHTYTAQCCAATPDGTLVLTGGGDNTVRLWSLEEEVNPQEVVRHSELVYGCTIDAAAALACSAPQGDFPRIWDARTGSPIHPIDTNVSYGNVRFLQIESRPRLATLGHLLEVFDAEKPRREWRAEIPVRDKYGNVSWVDKAPTNRPTVGADRSQDDQLQLLYAGSHVIAWRPLQNPTTVELPGEQTLVTRLDAGRSIATLHETMLEVIDLEHTDERRRIAEGVKACVGSPQSMSVYAVMQDGQLCRLDADSGDRLAVFGEIEQEHVRLMTDPVENAVWAICSNGGEALQSPRDEVVIAFSLDEPGAKVEARIPGHSIFDMCFLDGMLVTAGWDATVRVWNPNRSIPEAVILGSAPFRCVDAAGDRLIAGDQKGNVWFLAPLADLYEAFRSVSVLQSMPVP